MKEGFGEEQQQSMININDQDSKTGIICIMRGTAICRKIPT